MALFRGEQITGSVASASFALTSSYATQFHISTGLTASGLIYPSADNGEFSFIQTDGNGNLSLQYVNTLYEVIINGEATQLTKGTPVYVSGSQGANSIVYRADAANPQKMPVIYIAADNIAAGNQGRGIALGLITGVNTSGYPPGTEIYIAAGGGWTAIRPTGSAIVQVLGIVTKEGNGGQGVVLNPGPANLPNLNSGSIWVGSNTSFPTATPTASLTVLSSSYASTASHVNNLNQSVVISGSLIATQGITGSFSGSGANLSNIPASAIVGLNLSQIASGSVSASISPNDGLQINTNVTATSFTGSLLGTSSWAQNAVTSSYAVTASFLLGYVSPFPFTGSAIVSGSLVVTGSTNIAGNSGTTLFSSNADTLIITGSLLLTGSMNVVGLITGTASFAISASYIDGGFY